MKNYIIGDNGELILVNESEDKNDTGAPSIVHIVEFTPLQPGESPDKTDWHRELKESFRRTHPDWTERQLEIATSGK